MDSIDREIKKVIEEAERKVKESEWIFLIADELGESLSHYTEEFLKSTILWIGIGGSSSGPRAIFNAFALSPTPVHFFESPEDKEELSLKIREERRKKVLYVVSKSGETFETMDLLKEAEKHIKSKTNSVKLISLTQKNTPLWRKTEKHGGIPLSFPPHLSGRFSTFFISWIPMKACGINTVKISAVMRKIRKNIYSPESSLHFGIARFLLENDGKDLFLCFYSRRLYEFGENISQLIGESLGKDGKGTTPIPVLGPHFQHSVAQLILANPKSKSALFILPPKKGREYRRRYKEVLLEADATAKVFKEKIPVFEINLSDELERGITEFLFSFQIAVAVAGKIMGINPFNQPEVKKIRDILLGKKK